MPPNDRSELVGRQPNPIPNPTQPNPTRLRGVKKNWLFSGLRSSVSHRHYCSFTHGSASAGPVRRDASPPPLAELPKTSKQTATSPRRRRPALLPSPPSPPLSRPPPGHLRRQGRDWAARLQWCGAAGCKPRGFGMLSADPKGLLVSLVFAQLATWKFGSEILSSFFSGRCWSFSRRIETCSSAR